MARMTVAEARKICTPAEMGLLLACRPKALEMLSADELKNNVVSARRLRDKWRHLATEQRRQTQRLQQARVTDDNARSREKSALFAHALSKFEDQLKNVDSSDGAVKISRPAREKKPKKAERAQTHREVRSISRGPLKVARSEVNAAGTGTSGRAKKKVVKKQAAVATAATLKPAVKKKSAAVKKAAAPAKKKVAKKSRIKASGLLARVRGHVVASGRRAQGKRDSRG